MLNVMCLSLTLGLGQTPIDDPLATPPPAAKVQTIPRIAPNPSPPAEPSPSLPGITVRTAPAYPAVVLPFSTTSQPPNPLPPIGKDAATQDAGGEKKNGDSNGKKDDDKKEEDKKEKYGLIYGVLKPSAQKGGFFKRLYAAYYDEFFPSGDEPEEPEQPRRAPPSPWPSPPFPNSEYQGYPLIGVPNSTKDYPFMKAVYGAETPFTDWVKESGIKFQGWITMFDTASPTHNSNVPASYWIVPNRVDVDQLVFKLEKLPDTVQQDHIDWGFRSVALYGIDYRYTTAGGWGSDQLLSNNKLRGWDPTEQYGEVYIPGFLGGTMVRLGRWIACPDIESQYSVDNYLGSHSILFTYDTYTDTGAMVTQKIDDQWIVQAAVHAGTDMAPWYKGALWTGAFGVRWVSQDNKDAVYAWANALNSAQFRHFEQNGQATGHDNFNYVVSTWEHAFNERIFTKTEGYYMWQYNAELGGTPSLGPVEPWGGGGGDGVLLPGLSRAYGMLNYTMFGLTQRDYITVRNEWYRDERGMRTGTPGTYTSHTIGLSHQFNDVMMIRPEAGYYRNWDNPAFDDGHSKGTWIIGFDFTYRF